MTQQKNDEVRAAVRAQYGRIATASASGCCGPGPAASLDAGYEPEDLAAVPDGANLGLGCGNPQAIAELKQGETVLDLGAGAGFDAFLAARQVGLTGRVIGVDMTPDMVAKARRNAESMGLETVEFRLGEIESLPVADASIDVILSNCVINLSPDKRAVLREAFRVLRPGGRLAILDVVRTAPLPESVERDIVALTGCVAGAASREELVSGLEAAGFEDVEVAVREESRSLIKTWMPGSGVETYVASATVEARKPNGAGRA